MGGAPPQSTRVHRGLTDLGTKPKTAGEREGFGDWGQGGLDKQRREGERDKE